MLTKLAKPKLARLLAPRQDELFLGGAAGVRGGVVDVDSAGEGEGSAQGVGSLNRGAVWEGVDVGDRGTGVVVLKFVF